MGEPVRYNGGVVRADWVADFGARVETVRLCPEVAMGLSVPREAMRLARGSDDVRLRTSRTGVDMTDLAERTCTRLIDSLPADLDAAVLTGRSPLCGAERVKVYDKSGVPQPEGIGFFAKTLAERRPDVIIIDAGRLTVASARAHFLLRIETRAAARAIAPKAAALQEFHRRHKFLLMATGRVHLEKLGRIVADARQATLGESLVAYRQGLDAALRAPLRRKPTADALLHMYGFLKDRLDDNRRSALRRAIDDYRLGVSGSVQIPLALLRFCNAGDGDPYLDVQVLLADQWTAEPIDDP
jgi:uncharacterized protein YbbK (DUF523 family)/uncharacterized protein YbgA (DUF1722 family)